MPRRSTTTVIAALLLGASMGCNPDALTNPPAPTTTTTVQTQTAPDANTPLGDPQYPSPRPIPSRSGQLKGVVYGPKSALVKDQVTAVASNPTSGLLASGTSAYAVSALSENYVPIGGAKVVLVQANGAPVSEEVTTAEDGSYSFDGFLTDARLLFVKVTYEDGKVPLSLLGASTFPDKGEVAQVDVTPATTVVAKKAIEMVRLGGVTGTVSPEMLQQMGAVFGDYMSLKAVVAAAALADGKVADVFDVMAQSSNTLKEKLSAIATEAGLVKFLDKTPAATTTIQGTVYDESGTAIDAAAQVTIKSLDPAHPYDKTVDVVKGTFSSADAPTEVNLQLTVSADGWTSRERVVVLEPTGQSRVDFGGDGSLDFEAPPYFVSNHPEIIAVDPVDELTPITNGQLAYKITLSEALDETNQGVFASSLRIIPANDAADSNPTDDYPTASIVDLGVSELSLLTSKLPYTIGSTNSFLGDDGTAAKVTWDAAGKTATFTFNAPLITSSTADAVYDVALFNIGTPIRDKEGNRLGTDKSGSFTAEPPRYTVWCGTYKDSLIGLGSDDITAEKRWIATHHLASAFSIAKDEEGPLLQAVEVSKSTGFTRIQMTFNEPMAAFAGGKFAVNYTTTTDPSKLNFALANFTFAVATDAAALDAVQLDGAADMSVPVASTAFTDLEDYNKEFYFRATTSASQAEMSVDPLHPNVVRIDLRNEDGTAFTFAPSLRFIKARVGNNSLAAGKATVADPAGNAVTSAQANLTVKSGTL